VRVSRSSIVIVRWTCWTCGILWIVAGVTKILAPADIHLTLPLGQACELTLSQPIARLIGFVETALGVALGLRKAPSIVPLSAALLAGSFGILSLQSPATVRDPSCGCLGSIILERGQHIFVAGILLVFSSAVVLLTSKRREPHGRQA